MTTWPHVSIVMTVVNEERHLAHAVERLLEQDYPGELDIVIAVGPSRDRTREVAPLRQAEGALVIDTSDLGVGEVVSRIVEDLRARELVV